MPTDVMRPWTPPPQPPQPPSPQSQPPPVSVGPAAVAAAAGAAAAALAAAMAASAAPYAQTLANGGAAPAAPSDTAAKAVNDTMRIMQEEVRTASPLPAKFSAVSATMSPDSLHSFQQFGEKTARGGGLVGRIISSSIDRLGGACMCMRACLRACVYPCERGPALTPGQRAQATAATAQERAALSVLQGLVAERAALAARNAALVRFTPVAQLTIASTPSLHATPLATRPRPHPRPRRRPHPPHTHTPTMPL